MFPFIQQLDSMDCVPACLATISKYYGEKFNLKDLRLKSSIGKDGVSLFGIAQAAESICLNHETYKLNFDDLLSLNKTPCILHWDQNHFVVLIKIKIKRNKPVFYLADPAKGKYKTDTNEFKLHWLSNGADEKEGLMMHLTPAQGFKSQTNEKFSIPNRFSFLWGYFKKYTKYFWQIILGLFFGSAIQFSLPFLTQQIVDKGINGENLNLIWLILIGQVFLILCRTFINLIHRRLLLHISTRINITLISDFIIKLMRLPMKFFDTKHLGDLIQRMEDHKRIENFLTTELLDLIFSLFTFTIFAVILFYYNVIIFITFIFGSVLYGLWVFGFLRKRKIIDYKLFQQYGNKRNVEYQLLNGMQEIKLNSCEKRKRWEWEDMQVNLFNANLESLNLEQNQEAGSVIINEVKNGIVTVIAASAVIKGDMTLGMMLAVQYIIGQLNTPIDKIMHFIYRLQDVFINLDRMNEINNEVPEESEIRTIKQIPEHKSIMLKDVFFKYVQTEPKFILSNISLKIPHGKVTAIVGESGSGKTTLLKLLLGYYQPLIGNINIGDDDFLQYDLSWWRNQCGAVMQEGYIFSDSIARNIAVSDDDVDMERLIYAARIANISSFIDTLPLKFETKIGQDGVGISQGQKQRILIARVVYKNPTFVFLDEATNALDAKNEMEIVKNLDSFFIGKTVVIVAHRLSTVKSADQIIVLDSGVIKEVGSHNVLVDKKGKYFTLVKNQLELGN